MRKDRKQRLCYLFIVLCSLYFASCHNILEAPKTAVNEAGTGTLLLTIGENGAKRTIMPAAWPNNFIEYKLEFSAKTEGNESFFVTWTSSSSGTVVLKAGKWELAVTAYLSDGVGGLLPTATGTLEIEITSGSANNINVPLFPIITAGQATEQGTFRWNISFDAEAAVKSATMRIKSLDAGNLYDKTFYFIGGEPLIDKTGSMPLDAGQYSVFFKLKTAEEEASLTEFLHVYRNMESFFEYTFEKNHFPVSLLKPILAAWDASKKEWNFADKGIKAGHFSYLGIKGLDVVDTAFNNIVDAWFNPLCEEYGAPSHLEKLKNLVDAALIGMAGEDFIENGNYDNQVLAENAISELALNGSYLYFVWENDNKTVTVVAGGTERNYEVSLSNTKELSQPSYDGLAFKLIHETAYKVSGEDGIAGDVIIPSYYYEDGGEVWPVVAIADSGFEGSGLTSITIPITVTSIGNYAFLNCGSLTSVTMPPNGVTSIGDSAFLGCDSLTNITIPNSVASIGDYAFSGCRTLTSITIPSGVASIGKAAFSDCSALTSITIPSGVTSIGINPFSSCTSLDKIEVENDNTVYRSQDNCLIQNGNEALIAGCKNSIIPPSVKSIKDSAFYGCGGLTNITIPNSVTSIGNYAFQGCGGLTNITIPNSVASIGGGAFYGCSGLTSVFYCGTESDWAKIEIGSSNGPLENHIYYYSEAYKAGDYWHWAGETPEKWNNEQ